MFRCKFHCFVCVGLLLSSAAALAQTTLHFNNIDDQTGWSSCSACAGGKNSSSNYSGPVKVFWPSLDGSSAKFSIKNPWPSYANVLWWKNQLMGATDHSTIAGIHNITYDLYFYIKKPQASQALEFDVTQTICNSNPCTSTSTSTRYTYGTECNRVDTGTWRVWNGGAWVSTGIPCSMQSFRWNHVVWQFQRNTTTNQITFVSLTYNGATHYVNQTASPVTIQAPADDFNADFQMDGNFKGNPYDTWLDKINLTAWQ